MQCNAIVPCLGRQRRKDGEEADNSTDYSKSLVLPFSQVVSVATKGKDGQPIYYKGSIQEPAKQEEK
jgi:hypothetical protein